MRLLRRAAWFLSVLAMVLLLGLLVEPQTASAQTSGTLVSNTGQGDFLSYVLGHDRAQGFRTGTSTGGFKLTSVGVDLEVGAGQDPTYAVEIRSNGASDLPGELLGTLNTVGLSNGTNTFNYPGTGLDLKPNTRYHLVLDWIDRLNKREVKARTTRSTAEDSGAATGWTIDDNWSTRSGTNPWQSGSGTARVLKITITGYDDTTAPTLSSAEAETPTLMRCRWVTR